MCSVDYNKHKLFLYSNHMCWFINIVIQKRHGAYVFFEFVYPKIQSNYIKEIINVKNNILDEYISPLIDYVSNFPFIENKLAYFKLKPGDLIMRDNAFSIYVCFSNRYTDTLSFDDKINKETVNIKFKI